MYINPVVTVLMTAFNAEDYIGEAIKSILNQTFKNFELLIVDDGSADSTYTKIMEFSDDRIRVIRNEKNEGIMESANIGLAHSRGKYIARIDADYIAVPSRLDRQVTFMEANPEVGLCGSFVETFGSDVCIYRPPTSDNEICVNLLFGNCIVHSSVIMRHSVLVQYQLFYRLPLAEDYDLWCQMSRVTQVHNIPEVLVRYRKHDEQVTSTNFLQVKEFANEAIVDHLNTFFGYILSLDDLKLLHVVLIEPEAEPSYAKILHVIKKLNHYNDEYDVRDGFSFFKRLKKKILLHQMRATKKFQFRDSLSLIKAHFPSIYEILGYRYATKLLLLTLVGKRRK